MSRNLILSISQWLLAAVLLGAGVFGCGGSSDRSVLAKTSRNISTSSISAKDKGRSHNNISDYGQEASPADKQAITALVKRYYTAQAAADGKTVCTLLYSTITTAVPEDYDKAGPAFAHGKTCAAVMSKILRHRRRSPDLAEIEVTAVRIHGDHGFAELRSRGKPRGAIYVEREGLTWKIGVIAGYGIVIHR